MDNRASDSRGGRYSVLLALVSLMAVAVPAAASTWDFSRSSIPVDQIESGGPPRDGIPALFDPPMVTAEEADFLSGGDRVLGLKIGGEAAAYPIRILSWHELVNTVVGGEAVLVNW